MTTNHQTLRELAMKATPGPWDAGTKGSGVEGYVYCDDRAGSAVAICSRHLEYTMTTYAEKLSNAAFIAAANPQTIIALLDEVEALRDALEVEQIDLEFTIQAIVADDPQDEILLRVRDQKRRVTKASDAVRHAQGDKA